MSVRHALLALLSEGPKYGLQLRQEFEAGTGEVWPLNVGQVYTTLQRLERDGLVESDGDRSDGPKKTYRLTEPGRAELTAWLRPPPDTSVPPRDELVIKVLVASRLPGTDVTGLIQAHRRQLVVMMQHFTAVKAEADPDDVSLLLVADAEISRLDAVIRWLEGAETRLRAVGPLSFPAGSEPAPAPTAGRQRTTT
jgi:DNA-binding PadR family transcriptional regulator